MYRFVLVLVIALLFCTAIIFANEQQEVQDVEDGADQMHEAAETEAEENVVDSDAEHHHHMLTTPSHGEEMRDADEQPDEEEEQAPVEDVDNEQDPLHNVDSDGGNEHSQHGGHISRVLRSVYLGDSQDQNPNHGGHGGHDQAQQSRGSEHAHNPEQGEDTGNE